MTDSTSKMKEPTMTDSISKMKEPTMTDSISKMEEPKCWPGYSMTTMSIIWSVLAVSGVYHQLNNGNTKQALFSVLTGCIYIGVFLNNSPVWNRMASALSYISALMSAAGAAYNIWIVNNEAAFAAWIEENKVMEKAYEQEGQYVDIPNFEEAVLHGVRTGLKASFFGIMFTVTLSIYAGAKYAENAKYLIQKAEKESNLVADS